MKSYHISSVILITIALLGGCSQDATIASRNISNAADNFEITRRVVFFNGITDKYILSIEGQCSLDLDTPKSVKVTCKVGPTEYVKHYLGISDNVTYFAEQLEPSKVSVFHYKVTFKPESIIPDIRLKIQ